MENPIKMDDLGVPYSWKHPHKTRGLQGRQVYGWVENFTKHQGPKMLKKTGVEVENVCFFDGNVFF